MTESQCFSFSAQFIRKIKLFSSNFVRFGIDDEEDYVIICQFSDAKTTLGPKCLHLQQKMNRSGQKGETAQTKVTAFISDNNILSQLIKQPRNGRKDSDFHIEFNVREKVYLIQTIPSFERPITLDNFKKMTLQSIG